MVVSPEVCALLTAVWLALICCVPTGFQDSVVNIPQMEVEKFIRTSLVNQHGYNESSITDDLISVLFSTIVAINPLSALISALLAAGFLSEKLGRRTTLLRIAPIFLSVGCALMILCHWVPYFELLLVGRAITCAAAGISYAIAPVYYQEISPQRSATVGSTLLYSGLSIGILIGEWVAYIFVDRWQFVFGAPLILGIFGIITSFILPESPKYLLISRDDEEGARTALQFLYKYDAEKIDAQILQILVEEQSILAKGKSKSMLQILSNKKHRIPLVLSILASTVTMMGTGTPATDTYSTKMLSDLRMPVEMSAIFSLVYGVADTTGALLSNLFITLASGRTLFRCGSIIALLLAILFTAFAAVATFSVSNAVWASYLCGICLILIPFNMNALLGPIAFSLPAQIALQEARSLVSSVSSATQDLGQIIGQFAFYPVWAKSGFLSFLIFPVVNIVCFVGFRTLLPRLKQYKLSLDAEEEKPLIAKENDDDVCNPCYNTTMVY